MPNASAFLGLSAEAWSAIFAGISALIVGVGVPIAISTLRLITKQQYLASISRFNDELAATESQRRYLFQVFQKDWDYSNIEPLSEQHARDVINLLNRVALLVDEKLLPPRLVLSLTHTMIIRCWYQLEGYATYQEQKIGGRYARRVKRLDERAKAFHDVRPHQRIHDVRLWGKNGASIVVYKTQRRRGIGGVIQRGVWRARYMLAWY